MATKPDLKKLGFDHFRFELIVTDQGSKVQTYPENDKVAARIFSLLNGGPQSDTTRVFAKYTFDGFMDHSGLPPKNAERILDLVKHLAEDLKADLEATWSDESIQKSAHTLLWKLIRSHKIGDLKKPSQIKFSCPHCSHPLIHVIKDIFNIDGDDDTVFGCPCVFPKDVQNTVNNYLQQAIFECMVKSTQDAVDKLYKELADLEECYGDLIEFGEQNKQSS